MSALNGGILIQPTTQDTVHILLQDGTRVDLPPLGSVLLKDGHLVMQTGGMATGVIAPGAWIKVESVARPSPAPEARRPLRP